MNFTNAAMLLELCDNEKKKISEIMFEREVVLLGKEAQEVQGEMTENWRVMKVAAKEAITTPKPSMGGLIGGEARKLTDYLESGKSLCGSHLSKAIAYAMGTLEINASMGLIVAAVTAGSSGVIPGVLLSTQETFGFSDAAILEALYNAGAIGHIIAHNATVAGAEGGCQAEVGSASAMAASAVTELMGGTPRQCLSAAGTAITNLLGLVCDPIAGLVETPCQSRNAIGASNALICAEMALAGIVQPVPFDEIVGAMRKVGNSLAFELRETALGGIAATPTGKRLKVEIFGEV